MTTWLRRALLTIGLVWVLAVARIAWVEAHRSISYCAFGSCGTPRDQPFDWAAFAGHVAAVTAVAAVLAVVAVIWLRRPTR